MITNHTEKHWIFILPDGSKHSVGKYIEFFREEDGGIAFEGVHTEQEAIALLLENGYTEEDLK